MHEWALAEGIVSTATRIAEAEGLIKVTQVTIMVGELQQIEHDILLFAIDQLRSPLLKDSEFVLDTVHAKLKCRACSEEWVYNPSEVEEDISEAIHFVPEMAHVYMKCPKCGSPDFEVLEGRGVWLASVKGVKGDE
jgi:hydrogenase nickel incorporation protein HypA/HybF